MLGLLIVVTVVGFYLIGNRIQMILTILAFQMPEEQKKEWEIEDVKDKLSGNDDYMQSEIKRIESTDASSIIISGIPSGIPLLI